MADESLKDKQKKLLLTYQECAKEIKDIQPKVAYYTRLYGVDQAMALGTSNMNPVIKEFIVMEIEELQKLKATLGITNETRDTDAEACREWAKMVFARADKLDRTGVPENYLKAGLSFKRAMQFFKVASQFTNSMLPEDCAQLPKYAAWRSVELQKAHKEGRAAEPPPAREEQPLGEDAESDLMDALNMLPTVPGAAPAAAAPSVQAAQPPPPPPQDDFSFPTPPSSATAPPPPPAPFQLPAGVTVPAQAPPRHFLPGQAVKYCPAATVNCIKQDAVVQRIVPGPSGEAQYVILINRMKHEVTVQGDLLAPAVDVGSNVVYYPEDGGTPEQVEVEEVYASRWPPTLLIKRQGQGLVEVEDERVIAMPPVPPQTGPTNAEAAAAELAAERAAVEAIAAAEAEAREYHDLSTIGEEESTAAESEEDGVKSEGSSLVAVALVEETLGAGAAAGGPLTTPPPPPSDGAYLSDIPQVPSPLAGGPMPPPPPSSQPPPAPILPQPGAPPPPVAPAPPPPPAPVPIQPAPVRPAAQAAAGPSSHFIIDPDYEPPIASQMDAQKIIKSAGSALAFEDVKTTVQYLQDALNLLTKKK